MVSFAEIQIRVHRLEIEFSEHAFQRMRARAITSTEICEALLGGEVIESYPNDKYGPSMLIFGLTKHKRPLHVQVSALERPQVKIITVYDPNPLEWEHYRIRRRL